MILYGKTTSHNYATNLISNKIEAGTKNLNISTK